MQPALIVISALVKPIHNSKGGPLSFIRRMSAFFRFAVLKQRAFGGAGWSSPVARQAHNLKVVGSNPTPATNKTGPPRAGFFVGRGEGQKIGSTKARK